MEDNKTPKMNTKRVITALKNWSPKGLCGGTLVQKNGDPAKTEACSVGCLALDFATSKEGKKFFKKVRRSQKNFIKNYLYNESTLDDDLPFVQAMNEHYGVDNSLMDSIMSYNDNCIDNNGEAKVNYCGNNQTLIPPSVRKTIYSLRKKFVKFAEKFEKAENAKLAKEFGEDNYEEFVYEGK